MTMQESIAILLGVAAFAILAYAGWIISRE